MDRSQSLEDKEKSILIPYAIYMKPIRKLDGVKQKNGWNLSHRFIPNPKPPKTL